MAEQMQPLRFPHVWMLLNRVWSCSCMLLLFASAQFPLTCALPVTERFGSAGDGGRYICDTFRIPPGDCVVCSFGSNGDTSFEEDVYDRLRCEIHIFGTTPLITMRKLGTQCVFKTQL